MKKTMRYKATFSLRSFLSLTTTFLLALVLLTSCEKNTLIVGAVDEREANEIIVFLASNDIAATRSQAAAAAGSQGAPKWSISVDGTKATEAMSLLNQNGLPRIKGVSLLDLFGTPGMMSTEREGTIRYQAGLSEQIATTIRKIDGIIDADVQISFPEAAAQTLPWEQAAPTKITAAVYVKHQGILDDPNSHLITKIKRLVSSSVQGLEINDVTVISDRARLMDINLGMMPDAFSFNAKEKDFVSIWSIVMSKSSAARFRTLFFTLCFFCIVLGVLVIWLVWKLYPTLKSTGGLKSLFQVAPFAKEPEAPPAETPESPPQEPK